MVRTSARKGSRVASYGGGQGPSWVRKRPRLPCKRRVRSHPQLPKRPRATEDASISTAMLLF
jgi:hypothetical protein